MRSSYAKGTRVTVERSRLEVQKMLRRYGATRTAEAWESGRAIVTFELGGVVARLDVPMPTEAEVLAAFKRTPTPARLRKAVDQAERERWRTFVLLLKAKLEACTVGAVRFEDEFLSSLVLANGRTVGDAMEQALREGSARLAVPALPPRS